MIDFLELKKNLKKDLSGFKTIKVALLGDSSTQFLTQALKGYAYEHQFNLEIYEAPYNQIERHLEDISSELYEFNPAFVIIFHSTPKLLNKFYKLGKAKKESFAEDHISQLRHYADLLRNHLTCNIIYCNFPEINDNVYGNYGNKVKYTFIYQIRKLNYELMRLGEQYNNFFINDVASLSGRLGHSQVFTPSLYITADVVFNLDFLPHFAKSTTDIIAANSGRAIKCLILDLDNTMWGGIIGDDGIENIQIGDLGIGKAFTEMQLWIKQLKERGIILAVCSKNTEHIAKEPFDRHPDMVLKMDDIAVFVANWENKVDNIKYIKEVLNIGFDSMVFLDDSPFERNMVKQHLPGIIVPDLPEDPAEYLPYLRSLNLFEVMTVTEEDESRTQLYQEEAKRKVFQRSFEKEDDYLRSLHLKIEAQEFNEFTIPRVSQLIQRSNQFNLRTIRYTEEDIRNIANSKDCMGYAYSLEDKFGNYGIISVVILKKKSKSLFIDTWVMSCRVLNRCVENFVLNHIVHFAQKNNLTTIEGEHIPTAKNHLVKDHYKKLGFKNEDSLWLLDVNSFNPLKHFFI